MFHLTSCLGDLPPKRIAVARIAKGPQLPLLGPPAKQGLSRCPRDPQIHKGLMDRIWEYVYIYIYVYMYDIIWFFFIGLTWTNMIQDVEKHDATLFYTTK